LSSFFLAGIINPQSAFANPTVTLPATLTAGTSFTSVNTAGSLSVSGYGSGLSIQVTVSVNRGYVKIGTTTGLTAPTGYSSSAWTSNTSTEIAFYGSQTDVSNALNSLMYQATAIDAPATISVTSFVAGAAFNPTTGHFYEIVENGSTINWELARCKALFSNSDVYYVGTAGASLLNNNGCRSATTLVRKTMGGLRGYLATLTTQAEHDFLYSKLTSTGWIGGADTDSEGTFIWMDGPERGQVFWTSTSARRTTNTVTGSVAGFTYGTGRFNYFSDGEPNNAGGVEDFAEFGFGASGGWNDCQNACNRTRYVIEYGEDGDTLSGASGTISVNPRVASTTETDTALSLSGSQFLSSSLESPFDISSGTTFTLEAWINPTVNNANQIIIGKDLQYSLYIHSSGSFGMNFYTASGGVGGDSSIFRANSVRLNQWQHVAVVRNGTTVRGYIDGQEVGSATFSTSTGSIQAGSSSFVVGGYATNNQAFTGQLDQVRVWSSARSEAEIQAGMSTYLPSSQTSLIAAYGFNELSGTKVFDNATSGSWDTDLTLNGGSASRSQIAETSTVGAHSIVTFRRSHLTSAGGWRVPSGVSRVSVLVVAGGGGAGFNSGGGGSGGGISYQPTLSVSDTRSVIVGQGGIGAISNGTAADGFASSFGSTSASGGKGGIGPSGAGGASVSGSGAGGAGSASTSATGGNGANGPTYSISGTSTNYSGGGGGGGWITNTLGGTGGAGGGGAGGGGASSRTGSNNGAAGSANTGGGGGGGSVSSATSGGGGSGIVIVRWITARAPTFSAPSTVDTTTVGRNYTFRFSGNATSPLTRYFNWQYSSDTGTTWSTVQSSTSESYTATSLDMGTSGARYLYRAVITDSDTAGLTISDTSTAFYLIINRHPTISPPTETTTGLLVHLDASNSFSYSGSGSTWNDLSGGARHANLGISSGGPATAGFGSGVTCSVPTYSSASGGVFNFSGDVSAPRNCAWIPNSRYTDVGETYTVQTWVKPASNAHAAWTGIISTPWSSPEKINFAIFYNGTSAGSNQNIVGGYFDGADWYLTNAIPISTNSWNHLALVSIGRTLILYVNGAPTTQLLYYGGTSVSGEKIPSTRGQITGASKGVFIGRRWDDNQTFNGSIGTLKIASIGLTAEQIRQEYYAGSGRFITTASGAKSSSTTYATTLTETFTAINGTGNKTFTFTPNNRAGIVWDTSTANNAVLRINSNLNAGSYYETITATDSVTASTSLALTITVDKSRQATLSIGQYNAFVGVSSYPINVYGGSGTGAVTRSRTSEGTAGCTLTSGMFLSAARPGTCTVQAVKAGDTNYLSETATATIYWIQWSDAYATRTPSTPNEIVLNHQTAITKYNYDTLTVTSYQNSSGVTITSISTGATLRIIGDGFSPTAAYTEVVFASMDAVDLSSGLQVISSGGSNYLQLTIPSGATTGAITVNSPKGTAVGPSLTILSP
jgi:hypothetical protein